MQSGMESGLSLEVIFGKAASAAPEMTPDKVVSAVIVALMVASAAPVLVIFPVPSPRLALTEVPFRSRFALTASPATANELPPSAIGPLPVRLSKAVGPDTVGVTFDTCHVLDAGYDLVHDYDGVMRQLDEAIGLAEVKAIHVNDSQFGLGSHKDRHANIGQGQLGIPFFTRLVNDPTMAKLPMILETKEQTPTTHRDEIALLRGLVD